MTLKNENVWSYSVFKSFKHRENIINEDLRYKILMGNNCIIYFKKQQQQLRNKTTKLDDKIIDFFSCYRIS